MNIRFLITGFFFLSVLACHTSKKSTNVSEPEKKDVAEQQVERKTYRDSYTLIHDLVHTKLEVKFDWQKKYLYGKASIRLHPHFYTTDSLTLNARGMDIHEVSVIQQNEKHRPLNFSYDSLRIRIKLDKEYKRDEDVVVYVDYTSKPEELPEGGSSAITKNKGLYFINTDGADPEKPKEIWSQGETESNSAWFPTIEGPNQRMTQEVYITVDTVYKTLSNGLLITSSGNHDGTRTDYWKQSLPAAPYLTMIAVGDYAIVKDRWRNIEVNYYVEHDYEKYARMIFGHTPEMIGFFSDQLGVPFPWEKFSQVVVRDFVSGAMENTTAVVHREALQQNYREYIDDNFEDYISHELFHHWFGDLVTCESWPNITLNEGFANYSEYLWREHKFGRDDADYHNHHDQLTYLQSTQMNDPDLIRFDYDDREEMYDAVSYHKGGRVLHMLRKYVGDEAFFASLHEYLEQHAFYTVEIHDLRLAFEKVTGEDLNWFFNEWFLNHGRPALKMDYTWNDSLKTEYLTIEQTQNLQKNPLYKIPLLVDLYVNGKTERKKIIIEKTKEAFSFTLPSKPDLVNVDAEKMLLCTKADNKPKEDFIFQYYHAPLYLDRSEAISKIGNDYEANTAASKMMEDALGDQFWSIRSAAIRNIGVTAKKNKDRIKPKLLDMATTDSVSRVRIAALKALAKYYQDDDLLPVYENALNDSSYAVMTGAFKIICEKDKNKGMELAKKLEQQKDRDVMFAVASFYAQEGKEENNAFLVSALAGIKGYERYSLISSYSKYLVKTEDEKILQEGIDKLADIGRHAGSRYTRGAAVSALNDLANGFENRIEKSRKKIEELKSAQASSNQVLTEEGRQNKIIRQRDDLKNTIAEIKKNEKDKKLLKTYNGQ
ncbi:MAG: M1 family metallopeptidase [Bacteroidetes bacterium]|nr:M1 family metallopeptidase [Bacteroidota bacterium]